MGKTFAEKVLGKAAGESVSAGQVVIVEPHFCMSHDNAAPIWGIFQKIGVNKVWKPDHLVFILDHAIPAPTDKHAENHMKIRQVVKEQGIRYFYDVTSRGGVCHQIMCEEGFALPGLVIVGSDSHTCTYGGLGALAFGIGASELRHVLATQTLPQKKPRSMRIRFEGTAPPGVTPKDMILAAIGRFGAGAGTGHAVEYAGSAVRALSVEGRLTLCNLSIEMGAKIGMVAPDETTFEWLAGRDFAPRGAAWDAALRAWRALPGDADARFDRDLVIEMRDIAPQITWGTSPEHVLPVTGRVPDPAAAANAEQRAAWEAALAYMGLAPGAPIAGTKVDWVFIGSCTNSRIEDLRAAAAVLRGRKVAPHVTAWVVPGSERVKRAAEAEGLDAAFRAAGFEWREPGCALCVAAHGEAVPPGARCVSTSNRNFVGRQGTGARTHLASPAMAAAAAVTGAIADVRQLAA